MKAELPQNLWQVLVLEKALEAAAVDLDGALLQTEEPLYRSVDERHFALRTGAWKVEGEGDLLPFHFQLGTEPGELGRVDAVLHLEASGTDLLALESFGRRFLGSHCRVRPLRFINAAHLQWFFEKPTQMVLYTFKSGALLTAMDRTLDHFLSDFESMGEIVLEKEEVKQIRVEVQRGEFQSFTVNSLRVLKNADAVMAVGLTETKSLFGEGPTYQLICLCESNQGSAITLRFTKEFEAALYGGATFRGGKFKGDGSLMDLKEKTALEDLVLDPKIFEKVKADILQFFQQKNRYAQADLAFKRGVVLYGPPGTGKTLLVKALASTLEESLIWVKASDLELTKDAISQVFQLARRAAPAVVVFEDVDMYLRDRSEGGDTSRVATLMAELDGLEENEGLLFLLTTNRLESVEKAVVDRPGRIDSKIFFGDLGRAQVIQLLERKLKKVKLEGPLDKLLPTNLQLTGSRVIELATLAIRHSIRTGTTEDLLLTKANFEKAIQDLHRSENAGRVGFGKE